MLFSRWARWFGIPVSVLAALLYATALVALAYVAPGRSRRQQAVAFKLLVTLAVMAVGAGLDFAAVRPFARIVGIATAMKLLVLPVFTFAAGWVLGLDPMSLTICVMYATVPGSAASYIMARQMGGHGPLMAAIITTTTLLSMAAMPLALMALGR